MCSLCIAPLVIGAPLLVSPSVLGRHSCLKRGVSLLVLHGVASLALPCCRMSPRRTFCSPPVVLCLSVVLNFVVDNSSVFSRAVLFTEQPGRLCSTLFIYRRSLAILLYFAAASLPNLLCLRSFVGGPPMCRVCFTQSPGCLQNMGGHYSPPE